MRPRSPRTSARQSSTPRRTACRTARRSISACCSTGSRPSASRASPSTSPGAISRRTHRRFVIIDAPGHEQYTRNMATGASHADIAILLVDARHGVKRQTRRHAAICDLVGIKSVVLAVNKMDLIDWSEAPFRAIEAEFRAARAELQLRPHRHHSGGGADRRQCGAPLRGHALVCRSDAARSSGNPRCRHRAARRAVPHAGAARARATAISAAMPARSPRAASGQASASSMPAAGLAPRCAASPPWTATAPLPIKGDAVALVLDTDLDISRGAVLSEVQRRPINADVIEARLVWLAEAPFDPEAGLSPAHRNRSHAGHEHERLGAGRFRDFGVDAGPCLRRQRHRRLPHPARTADIARPLSRSARHREFRPGQRH